VHELSRDIALDAVFNLRDLGGYPTSDGRRTRWRRLFRGAGLHRLTGADADVVRGLDLRTAIDLRTQEELDAVGTYPDELPAAVHHLPMIRGQWDHAALDGEAPPELFLVARYRDMFDEGAPAIAESFRLLADDGAYPAAFYCAAGKDRTGVLAALVLDAAGVLEEHIVADYHLSKERVERIVANALASGNVEAHSAMVAQPPAFMAAPPEAMRLLLAWIREEHGSAAGYLATIGVDGPTVEAVRENVLEKA
jgi:protein-tyrosine phosphatase